MDQAESDLLDSVIGRMVSAWHLGDGGLHFTLDDGRTVIFAGSFVVGIMEAEESCLH